MNSASAAKTRKTSLPPEALTPGVADQGAGPDGRFGGQKIAEGFGGTAVGRGHPGLRRNRRPLD